MKPVKTHKFRGRRFLVKPNLAKNEFGSCDSIEAKAKTIRIPKNGVTLSALDTTIHESLHACFWDMGEDAVTETATCISQFLWRLGWRKVVSK